MVYFLSLLSLYISSKPKKDRKEEEACAEYEENYPLSLFLAPHYPLPTSFIFPDRAQ